MTEAQDTSAGTIARWRARMELTQIVAICALSLSAISFYRSYLYEKQQLDITVTEVSYVTNQGELYMTVAFANGGNRDAALLRVEPALWGQRSKKEPEWIPLTAKVHPDIAVTVPKSADRDPSGRRRDGDALGPAGSARCRARAAGIAKWRIRRYPGRHHELRRKPVPPASSGRPPADRFSRVASRAPSRRFIRA